MRTCFAIALASALSIAAWAQEQPGGAGPVPALASTSSSAEDAVRQDTAEPRDPFWPVGWRPQEAPTNVEVVVQEVVEPVRREEWDAAEKHLAVSGISQAPDGTSYAVLRGLGIVEPGDFVSLNYNGLRYTWRIVRITRQGVVPERAGAHPVEQGKE